MSRQVRVLAGKIKELDEKDPIRADATDKLLQKLHNMGLVPTKRGLALADKVTATNFCRRRLPVVMVRTHMAETMKAAVTFVEQGHVRVGPEVVTDPAFLVTRPMEDFITWTDTSAIKKRVMEYNDQRDDFDLIALA